MISRYRHQLMKCHRRVKCINIVSEIKLYYRTISAARCNNITMKQIVILVYVLVVITITLGDDFAERVADSFSLTKQDAQMCMNKTSVKLEDFMKLDEYVDEDIRTMDINNAALKAGCFFACLSDKKGMMSGKRIDIDKIKAISDRKMKGNITQIILRNQVLDTCGDIVQSKTDECEMVFKFFMCIVMEVHRIQNTM